MNISVSSSPSAAAQLAQSLQSLARNAASSSTPAAPADDTLAITLQTRLQSAQAESARLQDELSALQANGPDLSPEQSARQAELLRAAAHLSVANQNLSSVRLGNEAEAQAATAAVIATFGTQSIAAYSGLSARTALQLA